MKKLAAVVLALSSTLPLAATAEDWSGIYGGAEVGISKPASGLSSGNGTTYGGFVGYNLDMGGSVAGAELGYSNPDQTLSSGAELKNQIKVKARYGLKLSDAGLAYGTVGYLRSGVSTGGHATGYLLGVGYDHKVSDNMFVGAEYSHNRYESLPGGGEAISNQLGLRVGLNF
ncbi:Outer membrane protein beta-barrel domain-containing protein [Aliiroseovarius halocynthiae]|uniref:Porin family protein n=1 Tax=Aliiroseovarius halocynthiae TaxID=985055 RepID=A0A545SNL6_9RHOB|nr:porin family protein [Aliiroseovarius halocynthiae]TQV66551.1 porin family protein [Aliiroseovarius halocynthiae]SMR82581.1 Outer membrane protein beta-barrel domain-containing protein [Aliiroseovarius halocynthiae]